MAVPLRKLIDGLKYHRPSKVEAEIDELLSLSDDERHRRISILNPAVAGYVCSECLLYFLRETRMDNSDRRFRALYQFLMLRVRQALPGGRRRANGPIDVSEESAVMAVEQRFIEILVNDRNGYDERLDFFEVRFASAVKALRRTALSKIYKEKERQAPIAYESDVIDSATRDINPIDPGKYSDPVYRVRLLDAIHSLPDDLRQVLILDMNGFRFTAKDPTSATIGSLVGCSEQTARQRRDRAYRALRIALGE